MGLPGPPGEKGTMVRKMSKAEWRDFFWNFDKRVTFEMLKYECTHVFLGA